MPTEENKPPFATFEAGYGRTGIIDAFEGKCDVCEQEAMVLCIDSSTVPMSDGKYDSEYGSGCICQNCIAKAFAASS